MIERFVPLRIAKYGLWGLPTPLKLRPGATQWFDELRKEKLTDTRSGGPAFWLDPECFVGVERVRQCRPDFIDVSGTTRHAGISTEPDVVFRGIESLERRLMTELPEAATKRSRTVEKIAELPCWLLQYGGQPHVIAQEIGHHLAKHVDHGEGTNERESATRSARI